MLSHNNDKAATGQENDSMSLGPILVVAGFGLAVGIVLVFWAMLQNWMADVIHRA